VRAFPGKTVGAASATLVKQAAVCRSIAAALHRLELKLLSRDQPKSEWQRASKRIQNLPFVPF
jgi:hypothetical protein